MMGRPLAMVVLVAVLVAQMIAFAPGHSDDHAKHCCPVCHAAHAPLLTPAPVLRLAPPSVQIYWAVAPVTLHVVSDARTTGASTRGPPALSFAV